jgi:predicted DNA-binding transcriptional regulator AlpA
MTAAYLRTPEAASYLGIGRYDGTGPRFRQLGARIVTYAIADLDAWASENVLNSTSERAAA